MECPLCKSQKINIVQKVKRKDLVNLNKKLTKEDFSYLIHSDLSFCECLECNLKYFEPFITGDEKFYNLLQNFEWYYFDVKNEFDVAKKYIKPSDKVLEVGSGKGNFAKYLNLKNYVGLDFSVKAKQMALQNGILVENQSIEEYSKLHQEQFDCVVSFQVLEHVKNPKEFIEAKLEALKKGGKLIIAVPNEASFAADSSNNTLNMPPHHLTRWKKEVFEYIAKMFNLKILEINAEKVQPMHVKFWIATKIQKQFILPKLVDLTLKRNIVSKFSYLLATLLKPFVKKSNLPIGHTITAVFEK